MFLRIVCSKTMAESSSKVLQLEASEMRSVTLVPPVARIIRPTTVDVIDKAAAGSNRKGEAGLFFAGFRYIGLYNKTIGACFLGGLETADWTKVKSLRNSWLAYFTICCIVTSIGTGIVGMIEFQRCSQLIGDADRFHANAYVVYVSCVVVEAMINYTVALVRAPRLKDLIVKCSTLEASLRTPLGSKRRTRLYAAAIMFFYAMQVALCMSLAIATDCGAGMLHGKASSLLTAYQRIAGSWYIIVIVPQCLWPRMCMSYCFTVYRFYLRCIGQDVKECLRSTYIGAARKGKAQYLSHTLRRVCVWACRKAHLVEESRALLHGLRDCLEETGVIVGPGLLFTYGYAAVLFCASILYCLLPGATPLIKAFFLGSGCMHFGSLLLPTALAHLFANDVWRVQNDISSTPLAKEPTKLTQKVFMLINTLQQEDYLFNINGYFNLNLSTYTSIVGAALMYTVILLQTTRLPMEGAALR